MTDDPISSGGTISSEDIDPWGRSALARRRTARLLDPVDRHWFRVEWEGLENIPGNGPALLVANHAGVVPVDGALIMHGIERDLGRTVYALHHEALRAIPVFGTLLARNGGVVGHPDNALRLLHDESLVLVFPEGTKGTNKQMSKRYQLQRFGRGGFVETSLRAGAPIVPIAVMGTEETMPAVAVFKSANGLVSPITLNSLLLGAAFSYLPFPSKVRIRVLPPVVLDEPPGLDSYPANTIADIAEQVRSLIQVEVDAMVAARVSVLSG